MRPIANQDVIKFCEEFYRKKDHYKDFTHPPFIEGDEGGSFGRIPPGHKAWQDRQLRKYQRRKHEDQRRAEKENALRKSLSTAAKARVQELDIDLDRLYHRLVSGLTPAPETKRRSLKLRPRDE